MRAGAGHARQGGHGQLPGSGRTLVGRRQRQGEQGRVVAGRPAALADAGNGLNRPRRIIGQALVDDSRVLARQLPRRGVVGRRIGAEDQEALQSLPLVQGEDEAAGAVGDLHLARNRLALRRLARAVEPGVVLSHGVLLEEISRANQ